MFPVELFWKYLNGSFWICDQKSPRRSYSISRETTIMVWRIKYLNIPAIIDVPTINAAYLNRIEEVVFCWSSFIESFNRMGRYTVIELEISIKSIPQNNLVLYLTKYFLRVKRFFIYNQILQEIDF